MAVVAVVYYACARLGLHVAFEGLGGSAVWPASGVALAAVILLGPGIWPGILAGAVAANAVVQIQMDGDTFIALICSLLIGIGNTLEALTGLWLLNRLGLCNALFDSVRGVLSFVGVTLVACLVSSIIGSTSLAAFGVAAWDQVLTVWITWFTGDCVGILIVAPVLVGWTRRPFAEARGERAGEYIILMLAIGAGAYFEFVHDLEGTMSHALPFAIMPLLLLIAFRQPLAETATAVMFMSVFAIWGTIENRGAFASEPQNESLISYQGFAGIVSITILTLKAALLELRTSEARFTSLFKSHLIGITLSDEKQRVVVANRAFLKMVGYQPEDLPLEWTELRPQQVRTGKSRILETGAYLAREQELIHRDGRHLPVLVGSAVVARSMPHRVISVVLDLSARKRAEQQRERLEGQLRQSQKLEAVGTLATGVAHDFNNIITAILGYADSLRDVARDNESAKEAMDGIVQISMQASEVTRSLLTFSRQVPAVRKPIVVGEVVDDIARMLQRVLPASIGITYVPPDSPLWIQGDATQLNQVLLNLAVNARDAMPDGGQLKINVRHKRLDDTVELVVEDNGAGMDEAVRERIFEPFFTTKPREQGTGLGMSTVLGIVEDHDGRIDIHSAPGEGCRVVMEFPTCAPDDRDAQVDAAPPRRAREHGMALVVEDNNAVRSVIVHALSGAGFKILEAADGALASDMIRSHAADLQLAVIDIDLPRKSGSDCIIEFQRSAPRSPVIAISGNLHADRKVPRGAAFLRKPFGMAELCSLANRLLTDQPQHDPASH